MINFLVPDLHKWDGIGEPPELLVAPLFSDERPLRGAAGLVDWRLCGRLSRLLRSGRVSGAAGEHTLLPGTRLPFQKIVLFGLGPQEGFGEERFREAARGVRELVRRLGAKRYALPLPGRAAGHIMARRALELWLESGPAEDRDSDEEVWVVEPQTAQKDMSDVLGKRRA